jgi:hypothetical protein
MPYKRHPDATEITELALTLKGRWKPGEAIIPWLRKNTELLQELVAGEWTWKGVAQAMTEAGITYRTGRAWTERGLLKKIRLARQPGKKRLYAARQPQGAGVAVARAAAEPLIIPDFSGGPEHRTRAAAATVNEEPEFKPVSLKKPQPPRELTSEERESRAAIRQRLFGISAGREEPEFRTTTLKEPEPPPPPLSIPLSEADRARLFKKV